MTRRLRSEDVVSPGAPVTRLGRRGVSLLYCGGLDIIYGRSLALPDDLTRGSPQFLWYASMAPLWLWATLWIAVGAVCLIEASRRTDKLAFALATFLKVLWGLICLGGWLFGDFARGYAFGAIWLAAAGFVWVIAGWPEPKDGEASRWIRPF